MTAATARIRSGSPSLYPLATMVPPAPNTRRLQTALVQHASLSHMRTDAIMRPMLCELGYPKIPTPFGAGRASLAKQPSMLRPAGPSTYNTRIVQSWDVAATTGNGSDYSICRLIYPALRQKVIALAQEYSAATILIENAGFGLSLIQYIITDKPEWMPYPIGIKPVSTKLERLEAQTAKIEAGHLRIPQEAHWLGLFLNEMLAFPPMRAMTTRSTAFRNSCNGPPST